MACLTVLVGNRSFEVHGAASGFAMLGMMMSCICPYTGARDPRGRAGKKHQIIIYKRTVTQNPGIQHMLKPK